MVSTFFILICLSEPTNCTDTITLRNGETVSKCCVIPFRYLGELRYDCVKSGDKAWCSTTANYDVDQKKITCRAASQQAGGGKIYHLKVLRFLLNWLQKE